MKLKILLFICSVALTANGFAQCTETVIPTVSITSYKPEGECLGKIITLTANPVGGGSSPTYQWCKNGFAITGATNSTLQTPNTEIGDYTVFMTSSDPCVNYPVCLSSSIYVSFIRTSIYISTTCTDNEVTISAAITGSTVTNPSYEWFIGGISQGIPSNNNQFKSSSLVNDQEIYVNVTTNLECEAEKIITSNTLTYSDNEFENQKASLFAELRCPVLFALIGVSIENGASLGNYGFEWRLNRKLVGSNNWLPTAFSNGDTLVVYATITDFCRNPIMSSDTMFFNDPCSMFDSSIDGSSNIMPGQQHIPYSVGYKKGFYYNWTVTGGTIVSGQNTNAITVDWDETNSSSVSRTTALSYSISVAETNDAKQTKTTSMDIIVNDVTTSVASPLAQSGIQFYPNPATDAFNIVMPQSGTSVNYTITDLAGTAVANGTFTSTGGAEKITTDFNAGLYQVVLKYNETVTCLRLNKVQ